MFYESFFWHGFDSEPVQIGILLDCYHVCHFEAESKIVRNLVGHPVQVLHTWERVVCRVHANGLEHLSQFGQAVLLEAFLGETLPRYSYRAGV